MKKTVILIGATSLVSYTIGYLIGKTEVIVNAAEVLIDIVGDYIEKQRSNRPYPKIRILITKITNTIKEKDDDSSTAFHDNLRAACNRCGSLFNFIF